MAQIPFNMELFINKKINKWIILEKINNKGITVVNAKCECDRIFKVQLTQIVNNKSTQCKICHNNSNAFKIKTHGYSRTPTFRTWVSMLNRCLRPETNGYQYYGGRGIKVVERWHKFDNFLEDMGKRPFGLVLDRINNNGNYEKENCRWITPTENNYNRRKPE